MLKCCVCAFSLHRESPDMILGDEPSVWRWFCHILLKCQPFYYSELGHSNIVNSVIFSASPFLVLSLFYFYSTHPLLFDIVLSYSSCYNVQSFLIAIVNSVIFHCYSELRHFLLLQ
jgi:hypothetical protein